MKVIHVITGLGNGGAEGVLYRLCVNDTRNTHIVISLMDEGKYGSLLQAHGIKVYCLHMNRGRLQIDPLLKLWHIFRRHNPDVVQTWMYHADLLGGVVARIAGIRRVYWGIRHTTFDPKTTKLSTILIARMCAILSRIVPTKIVCCAQSAAEVHASIGYTRHKLAVIPNGFDLTRFNLDDEGGQKLRQQLGIDASTPLIGMVARFDPQKDHDNLLAALEKVVQQGFTFQCLLIGPGIDNRNAKLRSLLETRKLQKYVRLLGPRRDIPEVMNALDIHVLSSAYGEAFPNVVAEAMASGTPCVTTDVGDAAWIIGDTGWVVNPRSPSDLAVAIIDALNALRDKDMWRERRRACRTRIEKYFGLEAMLESYQNLWLGSLEKHR